MYQKAQSSKVTLTSALLCYTPVPRCSQNKWTSVGETLASPNSGFSHLNRIFTFWWAPFTGTVEQEPPHWSRPSALVLDALNHFNPFPHDSQTPNWRALMAAAQRRRGGGGSDRSWVEKYTTESRGLCAVQSRGWIRIYHLNLPTTLIGHCQGIHKKLTNQLPRLSFQPFKGSVDSNRTRMTDVSLK